MRNPKMATACEPRQRPCVDAPVNARSFSVPSDMWSGAVVCPASHCGSDTPRARMEMRGSGPTRIRALLSARPVTGFPDPVSLTVCPYVTSDLLTYPIAADAIASCSSRIPIAFTLRHNGPSDARHLVGQRDRDKHARFAGQHLAQPSTLPRTSMNGPAND